MKPFWDSCTLQVIREMTRRYQNSAKINADFSETLRKNKYREKISRRKFPEEPPFLRAFSEKEDEENMITDQKVEDLTHALRS